MQYIAPTEIVAVSQLLLENQGKAYILNGGTDLLVRLRTGFVEPEMVIDIKRIQALREITRENGGFRIGAAVTCTEMAKHAEFSAAWPGVLEAANLIGSTQVQGRATMAGNLCNSSPAADSVPALIAANATAQIASGKTSRTVNVADIPTGPGTTCLQPGEFITSFTLPPRPKAAADAYLRFIPRSEMDIAVVGAAVDITLNEKAEIKDARLSLGAVAPTAITVDAYCILATQASDSDLAMLAEAASNAASPIDDKRGSRKFRLHVSGVLAKRAAKIAYQRAKAKL